MFQPGVGNQPAGLTRGQLAAVLFVGGEVKGGTQQAGFLISNMLYQPVARAALAEGDKAVPFKGLLLRWMRNQTNEQVLLQLTYMVQNLNLKEGVDFISEVVREKKVRGNFLAQMVANLGRTGNRDLVPVLAPLLDDKTALGQFQLNQTRASTELRDVALSMLVHLTGQSHKDYGFAFLASQPGLLFAPHYAGFSTAEARDKALKKWQDWAATHKTK
jgi:hypothetical protein